MLTQAVTEAEAVYMSKVEDLYNLPFHTYTAVGTETIQEWLSAIIHDPNGRHRKLSNHATAS